MTSLYIFKQKTIMKKTFLAIAVLLLGCQTSTSPEVVTYDIKDFFDNISIYGGYFSSDEEKLIQKKVNLFEIVVGNKRKNPISEETFCEVENCLCGKEVAPNGQNMTPPKITFGEVEAHVFDENSS